MAVISFLQRDLIRILLGFLVGGIIGLERQFFVEKEEKGERKSSDIEISPGVRTFGLLSLTGAISVIISGGTQNPLFYFSIVGVLIIIGIWTASRVYFLEELGITTSVALVVAFLLGTMIGLGEIVWGITLSVFVTFILSVKEKVKDLIQGLEYKEVASALQIGILFFLLFPLVPDMTDPVFGVLNFRSLFFFLVLILSISFLSYVIVKRLGVKQGLPTFAALGAAVNSEAATTNLAKFSKPGKKDDKIIANSILLTNLVMIMRILFLSLVFASTLSGFLVGLIFILAPAVLVGLLLVSVRYAGRRSAGIGKIELENPLSYKTAIRFITTFSLVSFFVVPLQQIGGPLGYAIAGIVGGFVSNTAILFSAISSLQAGLLSTKESVTMVALGTVSGVVNKVIYARIGGADKGILSRVVIDFLILVFVLIIFSFWLRIFSI